MGWNVFEISINCFQSFLIFYFISHCLQLKPHSRIYDYITFFSCVLFFSLFLFFPMPPIDIAVFLIPLLFSFLFSSEKSIAIIYWNCLVALVFSLVAGVINNAYTIVLRLLEKASNCESWYYGVYLVVSNAILYLLIWLIAKLGALKGTLGLKTHLTFLGMISSILICEEALYYFQQDLVIQNNRLVLLFVLHIALIGCTFLAVYLFRTVAINSLKESRYQAELSVLSQAQQHQAELTATYAELISYQHDIKHHLQVLDEFVASGNNSEAKNYLGIIKADFNNKSQFITGCTAMDALLTAKYSTMNKHGIMFRYSPYPLCELPISVVDFCSVVGNILDNAVEGVLRLPQKDKENAVIHLSLDCFKESGHEKQTLS